jgi:hypothetical protein
MVNTTLLTSSLLLGLVTFVFIYFYAPYTILSRSITTGILTSIGNHGLSVPLVRWFDRAVMVICFCIHFITVIFLDNFLYLIVSIVLLVSSAVLYLLSKWLGILLHVIAHILITLLNIFLITYI